ncbi:MAG: caspase family protein [Bacteroidales bacterium]|nr:caspase family protein [Bacteroidales bacterium]
MMNTKLFTFSVLAFFLGFVLMNFTGSVPKKTALIIAVGNYPEITGWPTISSLHDTAIVKEALLKQGFLPEDIRVIADQQATKAGIVEALKALADRVNPGDIVCVHFSGHGQQIQDNDPPGVDEMDGYDEAMIPFDACMNYKSDSYKGEKHLRDEELGALLDGIRKKAGPDGNVLVVLDACHSGTGTRGIGKSRGTAVVFKAPDYQPTSVDQDTRGFDECADAKDLSPIVVFSAASANELNYEYEADKLGSFGSLSYAFSVVFSDLKKNTTYRGTFDKIKVEMSAIAPRQTPQVEGDVDRVVLGGRAIEQKPYCMVQKWEDTQNMTLDAGVIMGLTEGSEVGFFPIGTTDPSESKPFATGTISASSIMESVLETSSPIPQNTAKQAWVFLLNQNLGDQRVRVQMGAGITPSVKDKLMASFQQSQLILFTDFLPEILIETEKTRGTNLQVITADDVVLYDQEMDPLKEDFAVSKITQSIKNYAQVKLLKAIKQESSLLDLKFEFIPVTIKPGTPSQVDSVLPLALKTLPTNQVCFNPGDKFKLRIINNGKLLAYYNLLDIQPDNVINCLIPWKDRQGRLAKTPEELKIMPGETFEVPQVFKIAPPYGNELFILVAAETPLNLDFLTTSRGGDFEGTRGPTSPFEKLYRNSFTQTRGVDYDLPASSVNIFSTTFIIAKKD